mmetsp:Transcript_102359/g.181748  ORF Transcript_102359/g.181748 Transcript_102359/m.181748 type:complete len:137 (+) Transcript_102359:1016-1426(+)
MVSSDAVEPLAQTPMMRAQGNRKKREYANQSLVRKIARCQIGVRGAAAVPAVAKAPWTVRVSSTRQSMAGNHALMIYARMIKCPASKIPVPSPACGSLGVSGHLAPRVVVMVSAHASVAAVLRKTRQVSKLVASKI